MSRSKTRLDLDLMKEKDLINLMLFGLYRLKDDPMYASLCDLIFVLDKDSFYKLCATYGGSTIKIPTIAELEQITDALRLYQCMYINNFTFEQACNVMTDIQDPVRVAKILDKIKTIIDEYDEAKQY